MTDYDALQKRYDEVQKEYEGWDRFTDKHPYPSGLDKLTSLRQELDWLRSQLADEDGE